METVADVVATEEVATVADAMKTVADVVATEEVADVTEDVEMTVQMNSIERLVENDQVMLTTDRLKKSNLVDISDAITMTIKVKI
jgi:hypothetical protein